MKSIRLIRAAMLRAVIVTAGAGLFAVHGEGHLELAGVAHAQTSTTSATGDATLLAGLDPVAMGTFDPALIDDLKAICPAIPVEGFPDATNHRFYFLSEVGGCPNLPCFLAQVENTIHANATLVIDQVCTLSQPLRIPARFTLAGVGADGEGKLVFRDLAPNKAAISVKPVLNSNGQSHNVIRDLDIVGVGGGPWTTGINVSGGNHVAIENVRVSGFSIGLFGRSAYSVTVDGSAMYGNGFDIMIHENANHWSVRDSTLGQAFYAVKIFGPADGPGQWGNDHVFSGVRFEGSVIGAMRLGSFGAMLTNNRFESNGANGVTVAPLASGTRILANIFSTDTVHDFGNGTKCGLNINLPAGACPVQL